MSASSLTKLTSEHTMNIRADQVLTLRSRWQLTEELNSLFATDLGQRWCKLLVSFRLPWGNLWPCFHSAWSCVISVVRGFRSSHLLLRTLTSHQWPSGTDSPPIPFFIKDSSNFQSSLWTGSTFDQLPEVMWSVPAGCASHEAER